MSERVLFHNDICPRPISSRVKWHLRTRHVIQQTYELWTESLEWYWGKYRISEASLINMNECSMWFNLNGRYQQGKTYRPITMCIFDGTCYRCSTKLFFTRNILLPGPVSKWPMVHECFVGAWFMNEWNSARIIPHISLFVVWIPNTVSVQVVPLSCRSFHRAYPSYDHSKPCH